MASNLARNSVNPRQKIAMKMFDHKIAERMKRVLVVILVMTHIANIMKPLTDQEKRVMEIVLQEIWVERIEREGCLEVFNRKVGILKDLSAEILMDAQRAPREELKEVTVIIV